MNKEEKDRFYAFKVIPLQDLKRSKFVIESSCETCGHPFLRAADMCPVCIKELNESIPALVATHRDHLSTFDQLFNP